MGHEQTFRIVLITGTLLVFPIVVYYRIKSQATREPLDRWQEGRFILFTLRPIGVAAMLGLFAYMVNPALMAWSSMDLPAWLRWAGAGAWALGGCLVVWAFRSLGPNLTDTVVTRRAHSLVTRGPYRWVRHPFYDAVLLTVVGSSLLVASWFILLAGIVSFLLLVARTRIEEEHLAARFGDQYRLYMAETGRFLPRVPGTRPRRSAAP